MTGEVLVVKLGAMGDILHTLPSAAAFRRAGWTVSWLVESKWADLLRENPAVDRLMELRRGSLWELLRSVVELRRHRFERVVDFQGLIKSAVAARVAPSGERWGFGYSLLREKPAGLFYHRKLEPTPGHVVAMNLELAMAAGACGGPVEFPLPKGSREGELPSEYVLASPLAGWPSKQWPVEHWSLIARLARRELDLPLVVNGGPYDEGFLRSIGDALVHTSTVSGLIHATRGARAVVGLDSGPMHLAAALSRPGVAIFGPTDPVRNGPYGGSIKVLRHPGAETSYKRHPKIAPSMLAISPEAVMASLKTVLA